MRDSKFVITTETRSFCLDLPKDVGIKLKHKIDSYIGHNELLAEHIVKTEVKQLFPNTSIKTIFMNMGNSKTNKPHTFELNLSQRLDLRSLNKHIALQSLSIYYILKNVIQQYKSNKSK